MSVHKCLAPTRAIDSSARRVGKQSIIRAHIQIILCSKLEKLEVCVCCLDVCYRLTNLSIYSY